MHKPVHAIWWADVLSVSGIVCLYYMKLCVWRIGPVCMRVPIARDVVFTLSNWSITDCISFCAVFIPCRFTEHMHVFHQSEAGGVMKTMQDTGGGGG